MRNLERLLRPKSIAVFGGRPAEQVILQNELMDFRGEIWPVHPSRKEMCGRACFRSVAELPEAPDAAFVGVNRSLTVEIVGELAARGAGGAVCYASGFSEAEPQGEGATLQSSLLDAAGNMPIVGPNCYGIVNYLDGVLVWPDQHGGVRVDSGVAILSQSSNITLNISMQRRGLPIAYLAAVGNQAQTGLSAIASAMIEDSRVSAVGLHIETIDDVAGFERLALRARALEKPVVAITVGRSDQSRAAAISHTASIAGSEAATEAFFARIGVPQLRSIPEFLETFKLLHVHGALPGRTLCSMSCSGGDAALIADAAIGRGVHFRELKAEDRARVGATLSDFVAVTNPLDYHTFIWKDEAAMTATFAAMMEGRFDLSILILDFPRGERCDGADWDAAARALSKAVQRSGGRAAIVATLSENMPEDRASAFMAEGIAPLAGIDEALAAAEAAAFVGERWGATPPRPILPVSQPAKSCLRTLYEAEAKQVLAGFGLDVPKFAKVCDAAAAVAAAETLGYPVALKAIGVAHKSEAGAVRLNLKSAAEVKAAAHALAGRGTGLLVEKMVTDGVAELLIGVVRDAKFGLLMTIAAGGVLVELLADSASLLLPASEADIRAAILSLKTAPLLQGFRGRPIADLDAAVAAALAVARFAEADADTLEELDVNPLIVRPKGRGAVAVDALIRMRER